MDEVARLKRQIRDLKMLVHDLMDALPHYVDGRNDRLFARGIKLAGDSRFTGDSHPDTGEKRK